MAEHTGSWFNLLEGLIPESLHHVINPAVLASWLIIFFLLLAARAGTRRMTQVPHGWQNLWEWLYEVFKSFAVSIMGPVGERYMAFLACCFIYIFCCNLFGLIPGFLSPTATINMTAALAILVFVYVQYEGFRVHGPAYLKHFLGEPLWMAPLNVIIHVVGELAKPVSLSIRLFGNIFGEETIIHELTKLALKIYLPIQLVMVAFAIFSGFIQALIFTMLTGVYISLAISGEHEHETAEHAEGHAETVTETS